MKKLLVMLLTIALAMAMVACGTENNVDSEITSTVRESFLGNVNGSVYENDFIGIGCELDEQWTYCTEEELAELSNDNVIYDIVAKRYSGYDKIQINLEKVDNAQLDGLNIKQNFESLAPMIVSSFENSGCSNVTYEVSTRKIGDKEFDCSNVSYVEEGMIYFISMISIKCDGYLANITFTTTGSDLIDELAAMFYLI